MSVVPVADVLQGRVAVDSEVTVRGWVRTRRDSKAGISFLAHHWKGSEPARAVQMAEQWREHRRILRARGTPAIKILFRKTKI